MDFPDTPGSIALVLVAMILAMDPAPPNTNESAEGRILRLYASCLAAAQGEHEDAMRH